MYDDISFQQVQYLCQHSKPQTAGGPAEGSPDTREASFPPSQQPDQAEARERVLPDAGHREALPDPHHRAEPHSCSPELIWWGR